MSSACLKDPAPALPAVPLRDEYIRRCERVLALGLESIPAYAQWRRPSVSAAPVSPEKLFASLPVLTKADMRSHSHEGLCPPGMNVKEGLASEEIEIVHTSGSTGDQVANIWYQQWWDDSESSSWKLNSIARAAADGSQREAILTSPLCAGFICEGGYLPLEERLMDRFLFLNERSDPTTWTAQHMARMVAELNAFQPVIIEANPSFLARLSRHMLKTGAKAPAPALIVLTYENPSLLHYRQITAAFNAPVASSYGSTEAGYVFMECECGSLHQNTEHCHVDFLPFASEHGGPSDGLLLVTTFDNPWRVLIRFDIGDIARLADTPCPCGRSEGLTLASIEGRAANLTLDTRGRAVTQGTADRALAGVKGIDEYQVFQESSARYLVKIVSASTPAVNDADVVAALHRVYGDDAVVTIRREPFIRPDPPGKYRLTKAMFEINPMLLVDSAHAPGTV